MNKPRSGTVSRKNQGLLQALHLPNSYLQVAKSVGCFFSPDTCGVAASHNGDSALFFKSVAVQGRQMSDVFVLVLTVICLGGDLFLLDLFAG